MKPEWGNLIMERRFGSKTKTKPRIQRDSVTEYGGISSLSERLAMENKKISGGKPAGCVEESSEVDEVEAVAEKILSGLDVSLSIPPRVPYDRIDKEMFGGVEKWIFDRWKREQRRSIFERNIEIWRQLWITCERSDVIAQIVDARNPEFFLNDDVRRMYPDKRHILLINKSDLTSRRVDIDGYECIYYSMVDGRNVSELLLSLGDTNIGLIGYPNVGKSSTINLITGQKRVKVSQTPGKTKYLQTIPLRNGTCLLDCPGLVFPKHRKIDLILHGVLNVDQLLDLNGNLDYIIDFVGIGKLCGFYSLKNFYNDSRYSRGYNYISLMSSEKGWERSKCLKTIVKDFVSGRISYGKECEKIESKFDWYEKEMPA